MSDDEMRRAIAEACGWKFEPQHGPLDLPWRKPDLPAWDNTEGWIGRAADVPDYLNDFNAMNDAESLPILSRERERWSMNIREILSAEKGVPEPIHYRACGDEHDLVYDLLRMTARQRAEAFIATVCP